MAHRFSGGAHESSTIGARLARGGQRLALLAVLLCAAPADAQSNSLRKLGQAAQRHAPAAQPAAGPREVILPNGATGRRRAAVSVEDVPRNPALLQASLIAVEPPEPRTFKVHDLVTIIVREDKKSQVDAKLESEKTWEIESELSKWFRIHDHKLIPQNFPLGNPGIGFDFENQYEGEGKNDRKDSLTTRITAEIIDIKPNDVLVLEAKKTIELDEDVQVVTLTGSCRSEDVTPQNTILSTQLASAHITANHTGPARDAARRGWLMRAFDFLRPF